MALSLTKLLTVLQQLAPLELAESWDNVGLLIDPRTVESKPVESMAVAAPNQLREYFVEQVLLTIDTTPEVLAELAGLSSALLLAYHPPLFHSVKRVSAPVDSVLFQAIASGVPVYSPHTALDCVEGGVNDWLAEAVGKGQVSAVLPREGGLTGNSLQGVGRRITLAQPVPLDEAVQRVKVHLGVGHLRLARALRHQQSSAGPAELIRTVVVAAGSGSSVFGNGPPADLYLTGECGHHTVLGCLSKGSSVLLAEHTTTERGYLPIFRERLLLATAGQVQVLVASSDKEPLQPV